MRPAEHGAGTACERARAARHHVAGRLCGIRRITGGLFVAYGVIVTGAGINPSDAELKKTEGVHIPLRTGLPAMPVLGLFFLVRLKLRPAEAPDGSATGTGTDA
ncbi:hypothetical protein [Streptomyces atratus]|uniref:hypothetical protein n=1 Tax=Streptomyces atratus TaxID=1893 RepID=UPI0033DFA009